MKNSSKIGVICCDANDVICSWDDQAADLFGWDDNHVLGKGFFSLLFPHRNGSRATQQFSAMFQQHNKKECLTLECKDVVRHQDGSSLPVKLVISSPPEGTYYTIFAQSVDYPDRTDHPATLKTFQLEIINTILKISLEPILLKDRLTAIITYITRVQEFNLSPMASLFLVEQDTNTLVRTIARGFTEKHLASCEQVAFGHCYCGKAAMTNRLHYVPSNANDHSTSHGHYCVPLALEDTVIGVMNFYTPEHHLQSSLTETTLELTAQVIAPLIETQKMDLQLTNLIHDLRNSVCALREERNFSESVIQGLQHGLIVTDESGNIQKYNDAACSIFNWCPGGLNGKNLATVIGKTNSTCILDHPPGEASPEGAELSVRADNGTERILRYSTITRPFSSDGDLIRIISFTDISESKQVKKEMEKMNRLSTVAEIASAVAHEVRNPLAGIKIMAQSIEEDYGTKNERIECSRRIIRQVDRLNELLTDFFSYARPVMPKKQETSLASILAETKPLIVNKLDKQRIHLLEELQDGLPLVIADPNQLQQVFLNLFLNAIDAIRQEGTIHITACKLNSGDLRSSKKTDLLLKSGLPYVMVRFTDNGAGMNHHGAERVFEPFFTTKANGAGLGMSIVYRTLRENDATITVESSEGQGTTFTMIFKAC